MSVNPEVAKPSISRSLIRLIKLGISIFYLFWTGVGRRFARNPEGTCVVLYYHSVPDRYKKHFEKQMKKIADRGAASDIAAIDNLSLGSRVVAVTFDDALQNFTENALPVLLALNIPATVFVVTDALGAKPGWGEGYYAANERIMSKEQLIGLPALITIGSHTLTHPDLTTVSFESAAHELTVSREKLEAMLNRQIPLFSFPHGAYNEALVRQCQDAGYKRVFTTDPELFFSSKNQYVIGRVTADPWEWPIEFNLKILGAYCWQPRLRAFINRAKAAVASN